MAAPTFYIYDEHDYPPGHSREFDGKLRFSRRPPLCEMSNTAQVFKARDARDKTPYAVKMFLPYTRRDLSCDRSLLLRQLYTVSDKAIQNFFDPWHRESRAYEQIDQHIAYPARSLFPKYYGTAMIPYSSCPSSWRRIVPDQGPVRVIVLELLNGPRNLEQPQFIEVNELSLLKAKELNLDLESTHIFLHIREMVDILYNARIIHGDIKPDAFLDFGLIGGQAIYDFSISWAADSHSPCLDRFRRQPCRLNDKFNGEMESVARMMKDDEDMALLRPKFPCLNECKRCSKIMNQPERMDLGTQSESRKAE